MRGEKTALQAEYGFGTSFSQGGDMVFFGTNAITFNSNVVVTDPVRSPAGPEQAGGTGRVVLVGAEPHLPYERPPLSKAYLNGKADADAVRLRPERFFAERRLELRAGERAGRIDRAGRRVVLGSGEALPYDHLVLALGSRNRALPVPGAGLDGVAQLRTLAEAEALRRRLDAAREAVVVGAGFIGLEFAAVAAARGVGVTVVEAADRMLPNDEPEAGEKLEAAFAAGRLSFSKVRALTRIAEADGFHAFGLSRRQAVWAIKGLPDTDRKSVV